MGIRSEIKAVIKEVATCSIGNQEAINAIANIVQRPKPKPSRAALAEEMIAVIQEAAGECTERTGPQSTKPLDNDPQHDILVLTLTHVCKTDSVIAKVQHDPDADPDVVALAIASLKQFCKEKFGVDPVVVLAGDLTEAQEILKKF